MNGTILWDDGWSFRKTMLGVMYEEALAGEFLEVDIPHDWLIYDTTICIRAVWAGTEKASI